MRVTCAPGVAALLVVAFRVSGASQPPAPSKPEASPPRVTPPTSPTSPTKPVTPTSPAPAEARVFHFDDGEAGKLPRGWRAEGTKQTGPVATWEVKKSEGAASAPNVLALTKVNHESSGTFNICWTDEAVFEDGAIEVKFKAVSGEDDQGGGPMWRVKDKDNYLVARVNPLEENFRVYSVREGKRTQLASGEVKVETGTWHTIRVEQHGGKVECFLDGVKKLEATEDVSKEWGSVGGVGVWTKADAGTEFDDLRIEIGKAGGK